MSKINLAGMGVALITPFRTDKTIDYTALGRLLDFHLQNGTDYLVLLGTTAETPTLSNSERSDIIRYAVDRVKGRIPLVMGAGSNNTAELVGTLKSFDFTGIDAILTVTPYYNKPTQEGLYQHYKALSEVSPLPIILYNVPGRTGVNMLAETTLRIANEFSNIIGVKEACGNIKQVEQLIAGKPEGFSVISGDDSMTMDVIKAGGIGVISVLGNAYPKWFGRIVHEAMEGKTEQSAVSAHVFDECIRLLFTEGNPAGVKCILYHMGLIENQLRLPLVPVCDETSSLIADEMSSLALFFDKHYK